MKQKIKKHFPYYLALIVVFVLGIISLVNSSYNKQLQMLIIASTSFSYVVLALIHHYLEHDLSAKIVVEYILIGSLGMALFAFLLNGVL